jgi:Ca2+-transporting ATPase
VNLTPEDEFRSTETWYSMTKDEVVEAFSSDISFGLTDNEAKIRLEKHGSNELREEPAPGSLSLILAQLKEPLVIILMIAAVVSFAVGEWQDSLVILAIVVLNTVMGVTQETKAEKALSALKKLSRPSTKVLRGGHVISIKSTEVVPGDIILLDAGDFVPADARLIELALLNVDESALTGESVPAAKEVEPLVPKDGEILGPGDQVNMVFMSTVVTAGRGKGVVVATGMDTEIGHIAKALGEEPTESTPLQRQLGRLGASLGLVALVLVGVVFATGILRGEKVFEMFMAAVGLAVAAVPEGLPAVVTIILAMGVQKMSRQKAIVRHLPAVETLGAATLICTDKTGTLTTNKMTVTKLYCDGALFDMGKTVPESENSRVKALLLSGLLANDAHIENTADGISMIGDPTEAALIVVAQKAGLEQEEISLEHPRRAEIPFDSKRKMMTTVHPRFSSKGKEDQGVFSVIPKNAPYISFTKGAPDILLERCDSYLKGTEVIPFSDEEKAEAKRINTELAKKGLRVLAAAYREWYYIPKVQDSDLVERNLTFLGFYAMQDPPREEVRAAVSESIAAGVRPVMITGDYVQTATAIGSQLGIYSQRQRYLTGSQIDSMTDDELYSEVENVSVFARVSPEHKLRIVDAYKRHGHVVAMTGDGVNDAPALKKADIGVAMGITGTDVAKEASDIVIADDNFATIVSAIATGRTIFDNIRKVIHYLLSCNAGEITGIFFTIAIGLGRPLTAIQILWLNLVTDGLPALALGVEPPERDIMRRPPRNPKEGILERHLATEIVWQGLLLGGLTLSSFYVALKKGVPVEEARTIAFLTLGFTQIVHSFNVRSRHTSLFRLGLSTNKILLGSAAVSLILHVVTVLISFMRPVFGTVLLKPWGWYLVVGFSLIPLVVVEAVKALRKLAGRV